MGVYRVTVPWVSRDSIDGEPGYPDSTIRVPDFGRARVSRWCVARDRGAEVTCWAECPDGDRTRLVEADGAREESDDGTCPTRLRSADSGTTTRVR